MQRGNTDLPFLSHPVNAPGKMLRFDALALHEIDISLIFTVQVFIQVESHELSDTGEEFSEIVRSIGANNAPKIEASWNGSSKV